jgi:hypothetical protein
MVTLALTLLSARLPAAVPPPPLRVQGVASALYPELRDGHDHNTAHAHPHPHTHTHAHATKHPHPAGAGGRPSAAGAASVAPLATSAAAAPRPPTPIHSVHFPDWVYPAMGACPRLREHAAAGVEEWMQVRGGADRACDGLRGLLVGPVCLRA